MNATDWAAKNREYNHRNGIGKYAYGDNDLDRQRNGLHGNDFDWSKGSNSVKIGNTYLTAREYDEWRDALDGGDLSEQTNATISNNRRPPHILYIQNDYILKDSILTRIVGDADFADFVGRALDRSRYLTGDPKYIREVTGHIYVSKSGSIRYVLHKVHSNSTAKSTVMPRPAPIRGETAVTVHTHPMNGGYPRTDDIGTASKFGLDGLAVTYKGELWGYGPEGY